MSLFAKFPLAVAYKASLGLRISHIDLASADKKMIRIDAICVVAAMTSVMSAYINASKF
jgi:hypothetical protein